VIQPRNRTRVEGQSAEQKPYQSPPRVNEGHRAKTKSGATTLEETPNSRQLKASLGELSIEKAKKAAMQSDGSSQ
jgi:hypothetical protein